MKTYLRDNKIEDVIWLGLLVFDPRKISERKQLANQIAPSDFGATLSSLPLNKHVYVMLNRQHNSDHHDGPAPRLDPYLAFGEVQYMSPHGDICALLTW